MGLQLRYRTWGAGIPSLPILMLHGHPGDGDCMTVFAEAVAGLHPCVAPDLRGYGRSQVADPFGMGDHLEDLQRLLDKLGWSECLVLGWSLGGILALELALRLPERVKGLVLVATAACPHSEHPPTDGWDQVNTGIASLINWVWPGWEWNIETFGRRSLYRYLIRQHTPTAYRYLAQSALPAYLRTSHQANQALRAALRQGYNREGELSRLRIPALVMAGEQDCHITLRSSLATAQALPNSTWIAYPNTAHLFPWEIPAQVGQDLRQWLTAQDWGIPATPATPSAATFSAIPPEAES
ncbi:alpha/beta fold hydrolase [Thermostichus vulcanus]|uniref:Alpha/beta hydrolase n=1 Tax=Thermostichus vulcanus str. 'Rupite' TaxID=2813851 RepID=A0ABT0CC84_THEVL|nr:alpha/beta hydrolase [Thermostichus vulcanus str. 'Rupite']